MTNDALAETLQLRLLEIVEWVPQKPENSTRLLIHGRKCSLKIHDWYLAAENVLFCICECQTHMEWMKKLLINSEGEKSWYALKVNGSMSNQQKDLQACTLATFVSTYSAFEHNARFVVVIFWMFHDKARNMKGLGRISDFWWFGLFHGNIKKLQLCVSNFFSLSVASRFDEIVREKRRKKCIRRIFLYFLMELKKFYF